MPAHPRSIALFDAARALRLAGETFEIEAAALLGLKAHLGEAFAAACRAVLGCAGRVVVMGMGKSGHVGRKIAATLASTGTPALFVHPAEASHGDLGMVSAGDIVLAVSNSGESDEIAAILPAIKRLGVPLIAMTGRPGSTLARHATIVLNSAVEREACTLQLTPTASTTAQMALGDALAVALLDARGFREEDFARSHPGGALGRRLLVRVADLMRVGEAVPRVGRSTGLTAMLREMTGKGLGFTAVVDDAPADGRERVPRASAGAGRDGSNAAGRGETSAAGRGEPTAAGRAEPNAAGRVVGIFTDGDLRRLIERGTDLRALVAGDVMHPAPKLVAADALAVDAALLMEQHQITGVLVADDRGRLVGALNTNDLMRAKVI